MEPSTQATWRFESPVTVGREAETAVLSAGLAAARAGAGGLVFLLGEPGAGKSRLVRDFADRVRAAGVEVLAGRAAEGAVPVPYRPFAEVVMAATRHGDLPLDAPDLAPLRAVLSALVPDRLGASAAVKLSTLLVGEAVLRLARRLGPALLVLEDLQWADPETVAVVELLADHLRDEPVLCLVTARAPGRSATVAHALRRRRVAQVLELSPLTEPGVTELARACLGASEVPPSVLARLHAGADGLPLLVEELLAGWGGRVC